MTMPIVGAVFKCEANFRHDTNILHFAHLNATTFLQERDFCNRLEITVGVAGRLCALPSAKRKRKDNY